LTAFWNADDVAGSRIDAGSVPIRTGPLISYEHSPGKALVPEISRFLGIVIGMFYRDHNPPHFHARYGETEAAISILDGLVLSGSLPRRAMAHVEEWRAANVDQLLGDWERARNREPLQPIEPLE
jgi:hypothetical protein